MLAVLLAAGFLAGCAIDSTAVENSLVVPSYYDTLGCRDLAYQIKTSSLRVQELALAMEKSASEPGGAIINAVAYDTDYAKARTVQKYSEAAAARKNCDLKAALKSLETRPSETAEPRPEHPGSPNPSAPIH